jgi:hypothetical protein
VTFEFTGFIELGLLIPEIPVPFGRYHYLLLNDVDDTPRLSSPLLFYLKVTMRDRVTQCSVYMPPTKPIQRVIGGEGRIVGAMTMGWTKW